MIFRNIRVTNKEAALKRIESYTLLNGKRGYRVYFAEIKNVIILLLVGGDKSNQKRDIKRAKKYRSEYNA